MKTRVRIQKFRILLLSLILTLTSMASVFANIPIFTTMEQVEGYIDVNIRQGTPEFKFRVQNEEVTRQIIENSKTSLPQNLALVKYDYRQYNYDILRYAYSGRFSDMGFELIQEYRTTPEEEEYIKGEVTRIISEIIDPNMTDVEKVTAINDYIVLNAEYSEDTISSAHTAYTILKEGKAVCQGYALLAYLMLEEIGISSRLIFGYMKDTSEAHIWNLVNIGGQWFHVDVTFNDPIPDRKGVTSHEYLFKSDNFLKRDRIWEFDNYPPANSNRLGYLINYKSPPKANKSAIAVEDLTYLTDNSYSKWAEAEILRAIENKITTTKVLKNMKEDITREEFAELVVNLYKVLSGEDYIPSGSNKFKDTNNPSIIIASDLGIVEGVSKSRFDPYASVTREQMAVMLDRLLILLDIKPITTQEYRYFADESQISSWAKSSMQFMNKLNIIQGMEKDKINPKGSTTKEQAIAVVLRILEEFE